MSLFFTRKINKEILWSFANKGMMFFMFFIINIILARQLGVVMFGKWAFLLSIITIFCTLSYFGLNTTARIFTAKHQEPNELSTFLQSAFILRIGISAFMALTVFIYAEPLASLLKHPEFVLLLKISAPLIFLMGIVEHFKDIFIGLHRIKYNFIVNSIEYFIKLTFIFFISYIALNLRNIVVVYIIAVFLAAIAGFWILKKRYFPQEVKLNTSKKDIELVFLYSLPLLFISVSALLLTEIDSVMLGMLSTDAEVGIYEIAKQFAVKLPHIAFALSAGTMAVFAKINDENRDYLQKLFKKILKINLVFFFFISIVLIFFSPFFIPFIFGKEYFAAVLPLQILSIYIFIKAFNTYFNELLDYQGYARERAIYIASAPVLNIILNYILIPRYGATGAAVATTLSILPFIVLNICKGYRILFGKK